MGVGALTFGGGATLNPQTYQQIANALLQYSSKLTALGTTTAKVAKFLYDAFKRGGAVSVAATSAVASLVGATASTQLVSLLEPIIPGYQAAHMEAMRELGVDPNSPSEIAQATVNAALYAVNNPEQFFREVGSDLNDAFTSLGLTNYRDVGVTNIGDAFVSVVDATQYFVGQGIGFLTSTTTSSSESNVDPDKLLKEIEELLEKISKLDPNAEKYQEKLNELLNEILKKITLLNSKGISLSTPQIDKLLKILDALLKLPFPSTTKDILNKLKTTLEQVRTEKLDEAEKTIKQIMRDSLQVITDPTVRQAILIMLAKWGSRLIPTITPRLIIKSVITIIAVLLGLAGAKEIFDIFKGAHEDAPENNIPKRGSLDTSSIPANEPLVCYSQSGTEQVCQIDQNGKVRTLNNNGVPNNDSPTGSLIYDGKSYNVINGVVQ